jgi:predicted nucleotide-binding protein
VSGSTPQVEEEPVLARLRHILKRATDVSNSNEFKRGLAQIVANQFHHQLAKIYGKGSSEIQHFPLIKSDILDSEIRTEFAARTAQASRIVDALSALPKSSVTPLLGRRVFIGHGRSSQWRELKDFLHERLRLPWDEFNRESAAGIPTGSRLQTMMEQAAFAFLIMTAEEEHGDGRMHARMNVVHEVGLFQGRLGLHRAIVLLEDGCAEFSNIEGLSQIRFPRGDITARFEEVRRVLERERVLTPN